MAKLKFTHKKKSAKPIAPAPKKEEKNENKDQKEKMSDEEAIKKFYDSLGVIIPNRDALKNEKLFNLFREPKKDTGPNMPHIRTRSPGQIIQADLLFLPYDAGYRYALVVVDCGNRAVDAEPIKTKTAKEVLAAFKTIFSRHYVKEPKFQVQVDAGSEFKSIVKEYFKSKNIFVRAAQVGRHRQVAMVEGMNGIIGKALLMRQAAQELQTGEVSTEWIAFLPKVIKAMNQYLRMNKPRTMSDEIKCKGDACNVMEEGTKVRVALDAPQSALDKKEYGTFRKADIRFDKTPRTIDHVLLIPEQPPMYTISGKRNVAYTKNQLQVLPEQENMPPPEYVSKYIVEKILNKKKDGRRWMYEIKWKGFDKTTWEPVATITEDVPQIAKAFEATLK